MAWVTALLKSSTARPAADILTARQQRCGFAKTDPVCD